MSSRYVEKSDDITTDALPSPPRDGSENSRKNSSDDSDNKESRFEEINTNNSSAHSRKTKSRGFTNMKRRNPPTACASIININNSSDIHVGAKVTYNLNRCEKTEKPDIIETSAIKILRNNPNPLTQEDLSFVATHIDERWRDIGRVLNFSDGQIEQFFINNNSYGIKEVIYQLLLDWYRNEPTKATIGNLASILWGQNQKDVVKRWSERQHSSNI
ncbi:uncharacterized protein LOC108907381 [Anoplophora glabripennis]|uniref:uncharacterized protein LOC108907381 n=1 Tax=Anoplophora glabripennis TaxID=217634 RepID=UPI00087390AB|nr:uncharacterized protein LOC108907381 [Anoplophora glabripennis]